MFCMSALCSGFTVPPVKLHFPAFLSVYRGQGGQTVRRVRAQFLLYNRRQRDENYSVNVNRFSDFITTRNMW